MSPWRGWVLVVHLAVRDHAVATRFVRWLVGKPPGLVLTNTKAADPLSRVPRLSSDAPTSNSGHVNSFCVGDIPKICTFVTHFSIFGGVFDIKESSVWFWLSCHAGDGEIDGATQ